jgi:hypothetical protein
MGEFKITDFDPRTFDLIKAVNALEQGLEKVTEARKQATSSMQKQIVSIADATRKIMHKDLGKVILAGTRLLGSLPALYPRSRLTLNAPSCGGTNRPVNSGSVLGFFVLGLGGCASRDCEGVGSLSCEGKAAKETQVEFKDDVAPSVDKADVINSLREVEAPLRIINSDLFCNLNGWMVTNDITSGGHEVGGQYKSCDKIILIPPTLGPSGHELCHHISDWYGIHHNGVIASRTQEWGAMSCARNDWAKNNPEKCFVGQSFLDLYDGVDSQAEEEFASACANFIADPLGGINQHAHDANHTNQGEWISGIIGFPANLIQQNKDRLQNPEQVNVSGDVESSLPVSTNNGFFSTAAFGNGSFALLTEDRTVLVHINGTPGWQSVELPFDPTSDSFLAYKSGFLVAVVGKNLLSLKLGTSHWGSQALNMAPPLPINGNGTVNIYGSTAIVDGDTAFFGPSQYWFLDGMGSEHLLEYPADVKASIEKLGQGVSSRIVFANGKSYLWLSGIPADPIGRKVQLYRLDRTVDRIEFVRIFEVPLSTESVPVFYKNNWHLVLEGNTYDNLSAKVSHNSIVHPTLTMLRIENGGMKMTPLNLNYSSDGLDLNVGLRSMLLNTIVDAGESLVGLSLDSWNQAQEKVDRSLAYWHFETN